MKWLYILDKRLTYRSAQFYACLHQYCRSTQLIRVQNLEFLPTLPSKQEDYLIFVNFSSPEYPYEIYPLLARYNVLKRTIVVGVEDVPLRIAWGGEAAILELTGQGTDQDDHHVPGWGFVPEIPPTVHSAIPFEDKLPVFYFRGRLHGIARIKFLTSFREQGLRTKIIAQLPDDPSSPDRNVGTKVLQKCCDCLVPQPAPSHDYLVELNNHRFCLSPLGYGHTYRVLEGMAMGCLVIVDQIQHLKFCRDFFRPGENCLETGENGEYLESVIACCRDTVRAARIAANGRSMFDQHFRSVSGVLPSRTFMPILRQLDQKTQGFFRSSIQV